MLILHYLIGHALAHTGAVPLRGRYDWSNLPDAEPGAWNVWEFYPSIVVGCFGLIIVYTLLAGPLRTKLGSSEEGPTVREWAQFLLSIGVVFFSLQGPLHEISDVYLFSGHMVQHLLITLVFPPLFILGIPPYMWKPVVQYRWVAALGRQMTRFIPAILISTGALYFWHVPAFYEAAMRNHDLHIVEHLIFMSSAVVMWWPVCSRVEEVPRLTPGWRMVYLFFLTIPMKGLGAVITISDYVLYPFYSVQPRMFGLDPMVDQRVGGLIMWIPGGLVFWFSMGVVFFKNFYQNFSESRRGVTLEVIGETASA